MKLIENHFNSLHKFTDRNISICFGFLGPAGQFLQLLSNAIVISPILMLMPGPSPHHPFALCRTPFTLICKEFKTSGIPACFHYKVKKDKQG